MDTITTVPVKLPNKTHIRVEATPVKRSGDSDVSFESVKEALAIDNMQGAIEGIAQTVLSGLRTVAPHKASVEFGLEIGLESGKLTALWVKGSGKANLKITMEWCFTSGPDGNAQQPDVNVQP
jgi:hypothetical protein